MSTPQTNGSKTCYICQTSKPLDAFEKDSRRPDGRGQRCKVCKNARYAKKNEEGTIVEAPASPSSVIEKEFELKEQKNIEFGVISTNKKAIPASFIAKVASNQCKCGALLGEHVGDALTCKRTKCGGYNH